MAKENQKADFEGVVSFCEILLCGDRGSEVRFNLEGQEENLRACWASFRLEAGEHIRAYGNASSLRRLEVVNQDGSVTFQWRVYNA